MYEELVKKLRSKPTRTSNDARLMWNAADVIEELSAKYQLALNDLVKQAKPPKEE